MARRTRRATRRRVGARVPLALQRYVQRAVQRPLERKMKVEINDPISFNGAATVTGDVIPLLPIVQIGDTSYGRDGRSINCKALSLTLTIRWNPLSTGAANSESPIYATVWMVRDKLQKSFQSVADQGVGGYPYNLFSVLTDTLNVPYAPVGAWAEAGLPIDTRRWEVKRKRIQLNPDATQLYGIQGVGGVARSAEDAGVLMRIVRWKKTFGKSGKLLTYRTDGQNYPDNYNAYAFITYSTPSSPAGYTTLSGTQLTVQATRRIHFTDA